MASTLDQGFSTTKSNLYSPKNTLPALFTCFLFPVSWTLCPNLIANHGMKKLPKTKFRAPLGRFNHPYNTYWHMFGIFGVVTPGVLRCALEQLQVLCHVHLFKIQPSVPLSSRYRPNHRTSCVSRKSAWYPVLLQAGLPKSKTRKCKPSSAVYERSTNESVSGVTQRIGETVQSCSRPTLAFEVPAWP